MKKKLYILISLSILLLAGCGIQSETIRFGAAGIGGMYYSFATTFAGLAEQDSDDTFEVKSTAGSAANLRLLSDNYIDLGIAQSDMIADAYSGTGLFKDNKLTGYKAIANLYPEACQIVVRNESDIQTLDDLQGKTVSIGEEESGTERNATQMLEISGLNAKLINTVNLDYTDAAKELVAGKIDAMFCTAGVKTTVIEELSKENDIRLLSMDDKYRNKMITAYPFYSEYTIPAGTYQGQTEDVNTLCVQSVLLANDRLSKEKVQKLTAMLFEHAQDIQLSNSLNVSLDVRQAVKGITIPFHPGAAAYYSRHNVKVTSE